MESACSTAIFGPFMVDSATCSKSGRTYDLKVQHPRAVPGGANLDLTRVDYKMTLYVDSTADAPQAGDVIHVSGTLIPAPEPFISADSFSVLKRGGFPDSFDPAIPTAVVVVQISDPNDSEGWVKIRIGDCNRRVSPRPPPSFLHGARHDLLPARSSVGAVPLSPKRHRLARGPLYNIAEVTSIFGFTAEAIQFLPFTGGTSASSATPVNKKRKYERKNLYNDTNSASTPAEGEAESSASASTHSTPAPASSFTSKGKGRSNASK
ncbi:hypothetical protein V8E36_009140 [Tilletia maclaganii]